MKAWVLVTVVLTMVMGCSKSSSPETLITYRRSGGFAGLDDHLVIKENGAAILTRRSERYTFTLDGETVNRLQSLFQDGSFSELRRRYLPAQKGADLFEYVVTYKGHTVRTMDGAVPSSLHPVLEALNDVVQSRGSP